MLPYHSLYSFILIWVQYACGCNWCSKRGQEELPHVRGQGQKLGGPHAWRMVAKRSYPTTEVRGSSQKCQAATTQEWPRVATLQPRSMVAAGRSYPLSKIRGGWEEPNLAQGQGWQPGGASHAPCQGQWWEEQSRVQGVVAAWAQEGLENLPHVEDQEGR